MPHEDDLLRRRITFGLAVSSPHRSDVHAELLKLSHRGEPTAGRLQARQKKIPGAEAPGIVERNADRLKLELVANPESHDPRIEKRIDLLKTAARVVPVVGDRSLVE